ncbi:MAG: HD domain-containing protein [Methylococcales bacterium]|jgi:predicted HD phosphohydrolase|nr:HD domain-containing protein [Methylococcales bacterium]
MLPQHHLIYDEFLTLLYDLESVEQTPKYHPEGNALYHSLQVFHCAKAQTSDPELHASALLHDIGKAVDCRCHAQWGAENLKAYCSERVCWLIEHHLDLLRHSHKTQLKFKNHPWLPDLHALRRWDTAGRNPNAWVTTPEDALQTLFHNPIFLLV